MPDSRILLIPFWYHISEINHLSIPNNMAVHNMLYKSFSIENLLPLLLVVSQTPLRRPSTRVSNLYLSKVPEFNFRSFKEFLPSLNSATQISTLALDQQQRTEKYNRALHRRFSRHQVVSGIMPALWGLRGAWNHPSEGMEPSPSWIYNQNAPVE